MAIAIDDGDFVYGTHPVPGRRYALDELQELADAGDAWAMTKIDEWELRVADGSAGDFHDVCPDPDCQECGEAVNICCDDSGVIVEIEHVTFTHRAA